MYPFECQKFPFVRSVWRRKVKILSRLSDSSPTRIRLWEIIFRWRETVFRNSESLSDMRDNSFRLWDSFEGEKWIYYPVCRIRAPHVSVYGGLFSVEVKQFSVIGITFGHDRIPSTEEIFHFNGSVCGIRFSIKVKQFSVNQNHFRTS